MLDDFGRVAVNLEPRERLGKGPALHQRALRPRAALDVGEAPLQPEHLPKPLHVAPRHRQHPERRIRIAPVIPLAPPSVARVVVGSDMRAGHSAWTVSQAHVTVVADFT